MNGIHGSIKSGAKGEIYNICGSEEYSLNSVRSMLEEITSKTAKRAYQSPRPGDQTTTRGDFSKASKDFDYYPRTTLYEGLEKQINWISKNVR